MHCQSLLVFKSVSCVGRLASTHRPERAFADSECSLTTNASKRVAKVATFWPKASVCRVFRLILRQAPASRPHGFDRIVNTHPPDNSRVWSRPSFNFEVAATSRARTTNGTRHANILRDGATARRDGRVRTNDDPYDLLLKHSYYIGSHRAGDRPRSSSKRTTPASPLAPAHVSVRGGRPARHRSSTGLGKVLS